MKLFIAFNCEVAECELTPNGYPCTQKGAEQYVKDLEAKRRKYTKIGRAYRPRT